MDRKKVIGLVIAILVMTCFSNLSYGASAEKTSIKSGYCCADGKVFPATKEACDKQKGTYYDSKAKADAACKPAKGYCFVDGKVISATKDECVKKQGAYHDSKIKAESACKLVKGYCCAHGEVFSATQGECDKKEGTYYSSKSKADKACKLVKGYCCAKGKVFGTTALECKIKKGRFFSSKQQAKEACASDDAEPGGVPKRRGDEPDDRREWPVGPDDRLSTEEVRVTVTEAGATVRPGSTITVRYSMDEPLPGSVRIVLRHHVGGGTTDIHTLYEGAPQTARDVRLLLPADVTGEDHRILVVTVGETTPRAGESAGFDILGPPSTRDEINLSFGHPGWYMTPVEDETASLSYVVRCEGEACRGQSFQIGLMLDGSLVETRTLTASESSQSLMFWEPNCGGTVQLVIDPGNLLSETDETDNTWSSTVSCIERSETPKPDLKIYSSFITPWPIAEGERVTFTYSLLNTGRFGEVATGPFTVGLRVGDRIVQENRHAGMEYTSDLHAMPEGTITWTAHCGEPIALVVDTGDEVDEGDETNNVYNGSGGARPFECVPARVDLAVMLFSVSDHNLSISAGKIKTYCADIWAFRGDPRNVRVRCGIVGGEVLYEDVLSSLTELDEVRRGERIDFNTALCPAGRTFRLYCEVDPDDAIPESDETDNREEYEVTTVADPCYHCP